jgi:hypothetical protein
MITFANQEQLADKIARSLTDPDNSGSWQVILPPGFADEQSFADQVLTAIRRRSGNCLVACVHADSFQGRDDYARLLARKWGVSVPPGSSDMLQALLGRLSSHRPGIQVLTHFHKIVRTLDAQVLGDLRESEQGPARRLRTVTLTPLPYTELKERWLSQGVAFSVSDYGDTHHREDPVPQTSDALRSQLKQFGFPERLVEFSLCVTGGFPAPLQAMLDRWHAEQKPAPTPAVCEMLRRSAEERLQRFAAWLDREGESRYCAYVCDLYHGLEVDNARIHLELHPWRRVLLGPSGLLSEGTGACAAKRLAILAQQKPDDSVSRDLWRRARTLYYLGRYREAKRLVPSAPGLLLRPHLRLLALHASIMDAITAAITEGSPADADWTGIVSLLQQAKSEGEKSIDAVLLAPRYKELSTFANDMVSAIKVGRRVVDNLVGMNSTIPAPESAALLLTLHLTAGERITGPSAALKLVLELPEQVFRCWAFVALGVNFYSTPEGNNDVWELADQEWQNRGKKRTELTRSKSGEVFPNFSAFAYFALSFQSLRGGNLAPEPDFDSLDKSLSSFVTRNNFAHGVTTADDRERNKYFFLIQRWLDAFCACCPGGASRSEIAARADPLPLIAEDGALLEAS